jgi:hypothetical protein
MNHIILADEILHLADGPTREDHSQNCEVWHRMPWMDEDCDCGTNRRFHEELENKAIELAQWVKKLIKEYNSI